MTDKKAMGEIYWKKLNALPAESLRRFQEAEAEFLKAQRDKGDAQIWNETKPRGSSIHLTAERNARPFKSFYYWSMSLITDPRTKMEIVLTGSWYIAALYGIEFYFDYQSLSYQNQCPPEEKEGVRPPLLHETFPEKMKGLMAFDWDQDGDEDLAILLASGRYVFFQQNSCDSLVS